MWKELPEKDKQAYKRLIINFASLSEAFSQKKEDDEKVVVAPIVNSKFQETAFNEAFNAVNEDKNNTSYDASLELIDSGKRYLVGIKTFNLNSSFQKVGQFKSDSLTDDWSIIIDKIRSNASNLKNKNKEEIKKINYEFYKDLAIKISRLWNKRLASSRALVKGFKVNEKEVGAVYHILMTSNKENIPKIHVSEAAYEEIDIDKIEIIGPTTIEHSLNFLFTDTKNTYKYTPADSQLYMKFDLNNQIESWNVSYVANPLDVFKNLDKLLSNLNETDNPVVKTVSWMIINSDGKVPSSSGFNAFDGKSKLTKTERPKRIEKIYKKYSKKIDKYLLKDVDKMLRDLLLNGSTNYKNLRQELMELTETTKNTDFIKDIEKMVYRSSEEVYIPIPNSKKFHDENPDFFGRGIGTFQQNKPNSLKLSKEERAFTLRFMQSNNEIKAYICQDNGKAIQSKDNQDILGDWLLREVFQLKEREPLTAEKLEEVNINAIRLIKFKNSNEVGIKFIYINPEEPPEDAIGWIAKKIS